MHDLYKFLKRNSELFVPRYGMALHLYDYHSKFLCNRYGEV
jgi:glutathione peroxidase-family protein